MSKDVLTSRLEIQSKLLNIVLLGALPHSWSTFKTTQNSSNCSTLNYLLVKIREEETMSSQRTPNSTPSIGMIAYKNKRFNQRRESSKSWIRKSPNTKPGGIRFNNSYCKIRKRTNHATQVVVLSQISGINNLGGIYKPILLKKKWI